MIKIGERLPTGSVQEFIEVETEGCSLGPNTFDVEKETAGKTVVIVGLPGAFTPTCSARHMPSYIEHIADRKAAGVDEVWCISVNDPFVMGAWGRELGATGAVRMMGDGSAEYVTALGLQLDLTGRGMGVRSTRYSMLVVDGVVRQLNVEEPGKFEVSNYETALKQAKALK
ncbi:peroxiredoxin [soil metagenome]